MEALSGVSIELADNSITAIVGESGSGKAHLPEILSYIELPDAGKVTLDNLTVTGVKRKTLQKMRGKVQLVMQDAASSLDPHQNVLQILDEPLHLLLDMGKEDRKRESKNCWTWLNLGGDILNRRPDELSGGQQKRLCVARALATEPQHIIFDESFSGLDVTLRKQNFASVTEFAGRVEIELFDYYPRFRHCDVYGRYHSCDAFRENNRDSLQTAKLFGFS